MTYTSPVKLIQRFGIEDMTALSRKDNSSEQIDHDTITDAILKSEALINAHLASRYNLPFDPPPPLISAINTDLAYVNLFTKNKPPLVQQLEEFNLSLLQKLADGTLKITDALEKNNVQIESQTPLFNRKTLKAF